DHFERRQFRLAGGDARDPRAGARRSQPARLVANYAAGGVFRTVARRDPRRNRIPADRDLVLLLEPLWPALAAGRVNSRHRARRHRAVGDTIRLDAAAAA